MVAKKQMFARCRVVPRDQSARLVFWRGKSLDNQAMRFYFNPSIFLAISLALLTACTTTPSAPPTPPSPPTGSVTLPPLQSPPSPPRPPVAVPKRPPKIGLALGGGAARGFAHVGVIAALEEAGIKPDFVVGTSAGSLVAAMYASGKNAAQLDQIAMAMEEATITDWTLPFFNRGMIRGEALGRYVNAQVGNLPIERMALPLGIVSTDLHTGLGVLFQKGDTGMAVRASSAVPSVFTPVKIGTQEYVDGGLVSPVPVRYARQMGAELVIAIDISSAPEGNAADSQLQILLQTFAIMGKSINSFELKDADLLVQPQLLGVKGGDFGAKRRSIDAGRNAMQRAISQLKALIEAKSK
jgi:NTE family protein